LDLRGDEVMGEWRKLHNGVFHNLYSSPNIIRQTKSRKIRWAGHVASMGEGEGKRLLGGPRNRWEDGTKMVLREIGWGVGCDVDSPGSGQGSLAGRCECGDEHTHTHIYI
jgi:hypothetical protein